MELTVAAETFRLAEAFTISRGSRTEARVLTVTAAAGGAAGRGECVPYARYDETLDSVAAQIAGLPDAVTREGLAGLLPAGAARNAVDCALWDWEAKQAGKRVWQLAGLPAPGPVVTAFTLSLDTPDRMRAAAAKHASRPLLKVKLGTPDDMPRLEAVRQGAPDARIIVDANEGWSAEIYSDLAPHLVRMGVALVEQPLPAGADGMLAEIARPTVGDIEVRKRLDYTGELVCAAPFVVQVLVNLVENACHAAGQGGWIDISTEASADTIHLRVRDSGPGVPDDMRDKIFQPFFTTKAPGEGTGLGLPVSRRILEQHGGRLRVIAVEDGTAFEAVFPRVTSAAAQ